MPGIRTIHVATRILKALAEYRDPVRVTDLAQQLGMTMPTVSRHLSTWRELGFVEKADGLETYRLGTTLFTLGQAAAEQNTHVSVAYRFLTELRDEVKETTSFSIRVRDDAMVLACLDSGRPATILLRPGSILHLPHSPTARMLWSMTPDALERLDVSLRTVDFTEQPGMGREAFKRKIRYAQRNLIDYEVDVRGEGIGALCCPVFGADNKVVAVVALTMSSTSMSDPPSADFVDPLRTCTKRISQALGWNVASRSAIG